MRLLKNALLTIVGYIAWWTVFVVIAYALIAVALLVYLAKLWVCGHWDMLCVVFAFSFVPVVILASWLHKKYSQA